MMLSCLEKWIDKIVEIYVVTEVIKLEAKGVRSLETANSILNEVLYVLELNKNLLSICVLTEIQIL